MHPPTRLPCFFIGHGSPETALHQDDYHHCLRRIGINQPAIKAIVVLSAHWNTTLPVIGSATRQQTIHDFYGFPDALYQLSYTPPGHPEIARRTQQLLQTAGIPATLDPDYGLDHGAWVPLMQMYPDAQIPVLQISLQPGRGTHWHYQLGQALSPLRDEGVLLIASGSLTHNLRDAIGRRFTAPTEIYASEFTGWIDIQLSERNDQNLIEYRQLAPFANRCHPSEEHLLPLIAVAGASEADTVTKCHESWQHGVLQMGIYRFGG